ncbi:MAG: hypothetical protein Ct9H300mP15_17130 [Gemmatimonadota bacterium]|nr:MAG: hypothetical protein Ct9H300mP15_17130 [Gemmatimonadota bacterium]
MAAPGVVFSAIFGIPLVWAVAMIGVPTVIYTMVGGVQAVAWADVKQMILIVIALVAIMFVLVIQMPVSPGEGSHDRWSYGPAASIRLLFRHE